jgi:hypothetical protein
LAGAVGRQGAISSSRSSGGSGTWRFTC